MVQIASIDNMPLEPIYESLQSYEANIDGRLYVTQYGTPVTATDWIAREKMIGCRKRFVELNGWLPEREEGFDLADLNTGTIHMARLHDDDVATTMRLSPFEFGRIAKDSMSIGEMLNGKEEMREAAIRSLTEVLDDHVGGNDFEMYDLTRLTVGLDRDNHPDITSVLRDTAVMIGIGIRETDALRDDSEGVVAWTFCLKPDMKALLDGMGIQSHVLAEGEITPGDGYDSVVCVAFPKQAYEFVIDNESYAQTYKDVTSGINSH